MSWFTYIMTDSERGHLNCGFCGNLADMIAMYNEMPTAKLDYQQNKLVYLEQIHEHQGQARLDWMMTLNRKQKNELIEAINPDWIEFNSRC
jgi:predicted GIY-YIG superfamily endonuclease